MKYFGRVSAIICSRSSWLAWPDTWTKATSSQSTSAPRLRRALIARPITRSLPGMTRDEKMTRSPAPTSTYSCSPAAPPLPAAGRGQIQDLLEPVDVRGEGGDENPPRRLGEATLQRLAHFGL